MTTENNMDSDEGSKQKKTSNGIADDGDPPIPIRVRCDICDHYELDQGLLDYNIYFLLPIGTILWVLFLFV